MSVGALIIFLATLALGIYLFIRGWRGRKIDDHPLCAACGFDLVGADSTNKPCPECGADLTSARGVVRGHRVRRKKSLITGGLITGLATAALSSAIWAVASGVNFDQYKPTWLLLQQGQYGIVGSRDGAINELARRATANEFSRSQSKAFLRDVLGIVVKMRPRIQSGQQWTYSFDFRVRQVAGLELFIGFDDLDVGSRHIPGSEGYTRSEFGATSIAVATLSIPPGQYDVTPRFWFSFVDPDLNPSTAHSRANLAFPAQITVVPANEATVRTIADESVRQQMIERTYLADPHGPRLSSEEINFGVTFDQPPRNVAFKAFVRRGDTEWEISTALVRKGVKATWGFSKRHVAGFVFDPEDTYIVLRPSTDAAERTPDIFEIWDGEITIPVTEAQTQ